MFLFALAQVLEARTLERARSADPRADGPHALRRAGARRRGRAPRRPSMTIAPGARRSSSGRARRFPLDGEVAAGESAVNQAPVTGESLPVDKAPGRRGVRRHASTAAARSTSASRGSAATPRWRASSTSSSRRRRSARRRRRFVERFARVYTPAVHRARGRARARPAAAVRRRLAHLDLSRARPARRLVSVRAGHLDAGVDRRGAGRRRAQGRADQGRRAPRACRRRPLRRVRQDRHADARRSRGRRACRR